MKPITIILFSLILLVSVSLSAQKGERKHMDYPFSHAFILSFNYGAVMKKSHFDAGDTYYKRNNIRPHIMGAFEAKIRYSKPLLSVGLLYRNIHRKSKTTPILPNAKDNINQVEVDFEFNFRQLLYKVGGKLESATGNAIFEPILGVSLGFSGQSVNLYSGPSDPFYFSIYGGFRVGYMFEVGSIDRFYLFGQLKAGLYYGGNGYNQPFLTIDEVRGPQLTYETQKALFVARFSLGVAVILWQQ